MRRTFENKEIATFDKDSRNIEGIEIVKIK